MKVSPQTQAYLSSPERVVAHVPEELLVRGRFCPKEFKPINYLKEYGLKNKVPCIYGHKHQHGYVVSFEGENYGVMGNRCAKKHFGDDLASTLRNNFQRLRNIEATQEKVGPAIKRNTTVAELLPKFLPAARDKDNFFLSLQGKADLDFYVKLKAAAIGRADAAMATDAEFNIKHCMERLKESTAEYSTYPLEDANMGAGENLYMRSKRTIGGIFEDLDASQRFFDRVFFQSLVTLIKADKKWEKRVALKGDVLRVDGEEFKVPFDVPAKLTQLATAQREIFAALK